MANELLDFVMALVRDSEVAARYAADPAQAIADANLTDVTSADVDNLIPMVSDSLSMAVPAFGVEAAFDDVIDSNVWTSGAATAAFDAFTPIDVPAHVGGTGEVITVPDAVPDVSVPELDTPADALLANESVLVTDIDADPLPGEHAPWDQPVTDFPTPDDGHAAFDLFD
ncbi:MAG: Rv0340 family IniB-related protein [Mycobacterium sp.]